MKICIYKNRNICLFTNENCHGMFHKENESCKDFYCEKNRTILIV